MNKPTHIIIHCSDSPFGNAAVIDGWHRERGFNRIGYHYVIGNGNGSKPGEIEEGRAVDQVGAHAVGYNSNSIGICLIGPPFHHDQILVAVSLVRRLAREYKIPYENVLGHREVPSGSSKECPIVNMELFREALIDAPRILV